MNKIKKFVDIFVVVIFLAGAAGLVWYALKKESTPQRIELLQKMKEEGIQFSFQNLKGKFFQLEDFRGQVVLVNLWADWCAPCVEELPSLIQLAGKFPKNFTVIAVTENSIEEVQSFTESFDSSQNFIFAVGQHSYFSPAALPESYIFDQKGKLFLKIIGPKDWSHASQVQQIQNLLSQAP